MRFLSLTRAVDRTAAACSLQTQAGAPAIQAAQSAVQRSPPSVTHIMGFYSFNRPWRDGRLSWPCWLTASGRCTHKVVMHPSISLAQDKESPPARTDVLTTTLRHHWVCDLSCSRLACRWASLLRDIWSCCSAVWQSVMLATTRVHPGTLSALMSRLHCLLCSVCTQHYACFFHRLWHSLVAAFVSFIDLCVMFSVILCYTVFLESL